MFGVARLSLRDAIDFKSDTPGKFNPGVSDVKSMASRRLYRATPNMLRHEKDVKL